MARRVLVLGATSYVAQFVLRRFLEDATISESVERLACTLRSGSELPSGLVPAANEGEVEGRAERRVEVYENVDFTDLDTVRACIASFRPHAVVNCVALSSPATCERQPELSKALNEPYPLLEILHEIGTPIHLVHFSTDFVYRGDRPAGSSYAEDDAVLGGEHGPLLSVYGSGKLSFDTFVQSNPPPGGCSVLRIANVVGPRAPLFSGGGPKFLEWLHTQLFASADAMTPLKLWSDEYRSFIYVEDLVEIVFEVVKNVAGKTIGVAQVINVGGQEALTRVELARRYLAACIPAGLTTENTDTIREIAPTSRANVDFGYHSPLNAQLDTSRLGMLLPGLSRTPTDAFLKTIAHEMR